MTRIPQMEKPRQEGRSLKPLLPCPYWNHHLKDSAATQPARARPVGNSSFIWVLTTVSLPTFSQPWAVCVSEGALEQDPRPLPCYTQPLEGLTLSQSLPFSLWPAGALTPL